MPGDRASPWVIGGDLTIADLGIAELIIEQGGAVDSASGSIGRNAGALGAVTVTGPGSIWAQSGNLQVGEYGSGTLTIEDGGIVTNGFSVVGSHGGATGAVIVGNGSQWISSGGLYVGDYGTGAVTVRDGGFVSSQEGYVGGNAGSVGQITITGTGSSWTTNFLSVGNAGSGTLTVDAGAAVDISESIVGLLQGASGTITVSGGASLDATGNQVIGFLGTGTLNIASGGVVANENSFLGQQAGSTGNATISGAGSSWTTRGGLFVGDRSVGTMLVQDGASLQSAYSFIGGNTDASGTVTVTGPGTRWINDGGMFVGTSGAGSLTIGDGALVRSGGGFGILDIALASGSTGTLTIGTRDVTPVAAGILEAGEVRFGAGTAAINFNHTTADYVFSTLITGAGALNHYAGTTILIANNSYSGATAIQGGTLQLGNGGTVGWIVDGDILNQGVLAFNRSDDVTYSGAISGSGGIAQLGAGTLTLTGGNSYTGATRVETGRLEAGAANVLGSGSAITIAASAVLELKGFDQEAGSLAGGGTIESSTGTATLTTGTDGSTTLFSGTITSPASVLNLVKVGTGTLTLSGDNDYSGETVIRGGTLALEGQNDQGTNSYYIGREAGDDGALIIASGGGLDSGESYIGDAVGAAGSAVIAGTGSRWTVAGDLFVGNGGAATLSITNGGSLANSAAQIGYLAGSSGTATVTGAGSTWASSGNLIVGGNGSATLTIANGGSVQLASGQRRISIAAATGSTGTLNIGAGSGAAVAPGSIDAAEIVFGSGAATINFNHSGSAYVFNVPISGSGKVNHFAGTTILRGTNSYVGDTDVRGGILVVEGQGDQGSGAYRIGLDNGDDGALIIRASGALVSGTGIIAENAGSAGAVTLEDGSSWTSNGLLHIGQGGTGALFILEGSALETGAAHIGTEAGATGSAEISGAGSAWSSDGDLSIGTRGSGTLLVEDGGFAGNVMGIVGVEAGATGMVTVDGPGSRWASSDQLFLGLGGSAALTIADGGTVASLDASIGVNAGAQGSATITGTGSNWTVAGDFDIGRAGDGTLTLSDGGRMEVSGITHIAMDAASSGTLNIGSAAGQTAIAAGVLDSAEVRFGSGAGSINFNHTDTGYVFSPLISGGGTVDQRAGTTILTADNNYTGAISIFGGTLHLTGMSSGTGDTTVFGGTLIVDGGSHSATTVRSGGALAGEGRIDASVMIEDGGTLYGVQGSTLTLGSLTLGSSSVTDIMLGAAGGSGALFDVTGDLTLDGLLDIADAGGFGVGVYTLFTYGGSLTDNGLVLGALPGTTSPDTLFVQTGAANQVNLVNSVGADLLFWDGGNTALHDNAAVDGGSGIWRADARVWTQSDGTINGAMHPEPGFAIFQGAPGIITVDGSQGAIGVTGMQFAANGYTLAGDAVELQGGATTIIRVGNGAASGAAYTATIDAQLAGASALQKTDRGTLILTGANSYTGGTTVAAGTLQIGSGGTTGSVSGNVADNGTLRFNRSDNLGFAGNISGSGRLEQAGTGTLTLTGNASHGGGTTISVGTIQIGDGGTAGSIAGDIVNNGALRFNRSDSLGFAGNISGSGSLTQAGTGTLMLTGDASHIGGTTILAGTLQVGDGDTAGSVSGDIVNNGTLVFNRSDAVMQSAAISGTGALRQDGSGVLVVTGDASHSGGTVVTAGTLQIGNGDTSGSILGDIVNNGTLSFYRSDGLGFAGDISGNGSLVQAGTGTLTLTGNASHIGGTAISTGILQIGNGGTAGSIGGNIVNNGTLAFDRSDTLIYGGDISGAGALVQNGTGTLILTGSASHNGGTTITGGSLQIGNGGTTGAVNGDIVNDGTLIFNRSDASVYGASLLGSGSVIQMAGRLTLTGDSGAFLGATRVEGGVLDIQGTLGSVSSSLIVDGGGTLTGTGSVGGNVAILDGGRLSGIQGQKLTMASLALSSGSVLDVGLGTANSGDALFDVAGDLILDGTLNLTDAGGFGAGVYRLFDYGGSLTDNGLDIDILPQGQSAADIGVQTSVGSQVNLINLAGQDLYFWDGAEANWNNGRVDGGAGIWTADSGNWTTADGALNGVMRPQPGFAVFQGAGGLITVDDNAGTVGVSGIQFAADNYRITGDDILLSGATVLVRVGNGATSGGSYAATVSAALTGTSALVKTDLGTLILTGSNSYTGGTTVQSGTLQIGDGGLSGSVLGDIVNNGTLRFNRSDTIRLVNAISGSGSMVQAGTGTVIVTGGVSHSGGTMIVAGTLQIGDGGATGSVGGDIVNNGTLVFNRSDAFTHAGAFLGTGNLVQSGGRLTLSGDSGAFAGTTRITGGTLDVAGTLGSSASGLIVASGGTLAGAGIVGGAVTILNGGNLSGVQGQTLTISALNLSPGAVINIALGNSGSENAIFGITGDLVLDGTLNVSDMGGFGAGVYRLFDYGGNLTDNGLVIGRLPAKGGADLSLQTSVSAQINLVNSAGQDLHFWDGASAHWDNGRVDGGTGIWSANSANWTSADGAFNGVMRPRPGFAIFQGQGGIVTVDDSAGAISVTGMQFAADNYRVAGSDILLSPGNAVIRVGTGAASGAGYTATISAALIGDGTLVKTDLGTLILEGSNTYSGGTIVQSGTLVGNAASLQGNIQNDARLIFNQNEDASFAGTITGSGEVVKSGVGALTLATANSSNWLVREGGLVSTSALFTGNLIVERGASFVFSQSGNGNYEGNFSGEGQLRFSGGGEVLLTGGSSGYAGQARVDSGTFRVNGVLGGTLLVDAGARLEGTGTLGTVRVAGTVAPGNSIGTITVNGDLVFAASAAFEVEVDAQGRSDRLIVGGKATIEGGSVLSLASGGEYAPSTDYTILTAAGGVSGAFGSVTSNLAFLNPSLLYAANNVTLRLTRNAVEFRDVGETVNQRAVAPALEALGSGNPIYDALVSLDADDARLGYDQLSGEGHASLRGSLIEEGQFILDTILAQPSEGRGGFWGSVLHNRGDVEADGNAGGFDRRTRGFTTGVNIPVGSHWRFGLSYGYDDSDLRGDTGFAADTKSHFASAYAATRYHALSARFGVVQGWHDIATTRAIVFPGFTSEAKASRAASSTQLFGQIGWRFGSNQTYAEPYAGLSYASLRDEAFTETGGPVALQIRSQNIHATQATLGLRARATLSYTLLPISLYGSAEYQRTFADNPAANVSFVPGSSFTVRGTALSPNAALMRAGAEATISKDVSLSLGYAGRWSQSAQDHRVEAGLSLAF